MLLPMIGFGSETMGEKIVAGVIEPVAIGTSGLLLDAKLDTGADSCSLHALNIQNFDRNGGKWIRFDVTNRDGRTETLEAPLVRTVRIKRRTGPALIRPVVRLRLCLGKLQREINVNLADRGHFKYPALIGRNFLAGYVVVDAALERTLQPDCAAAPRR